ncbi:MAG: beta-galactosidase, partial [Verrucomicrobia bacterium]|nr:beta-galactosidase [Verrucomicrobiota bacterium]
MATADKLNVINLAGHWAFCLDPDNVGIRQQWFLRDLDDTVRLPGTTDENAKGERVDEQCDDRLSRVWRWIGPAWYQRSVSIPPAWQGKHITLRLERTKHSTVWVDAVRVGTEDSLSAPHVYELSGLLSPGPHRISILVDNARLPPVGPCHAVDERTQTNWNGIIGRIELEAHDPVWLADLQVYPDIERKQIELQMTIANRTSWRGPCDLTVTVTLLDEPCVVCKPLMTTEPCVGRTTHCRLHLSIPHNMPVWDEFSPARVCVSVNLKCQTDDELFEDTRAVTTGLRTFRTIRGQFCINGNVTFLRGRHDACIFPLPGSPPMNKDGWLRVFRIGKSYGLNHHRFHSWCPPEAAFEAADELGVYLQCELPNKAGIMAPSSEPYVLPANAFETQDEIDASASRAPEDTASYLRREGEKILVAFGNHASFVMLTLGNEIGGDRPVMKGLCDHFRDLDARHLYAQGSNHFHWELGLQEGDEFWVTGATAHQRPTRGSSFQGSHAGHIENRSPSTCVDYSDSIAGIPVPVVGHETGQYQISPDYREIPKYTGVLRARNLEMFRDRLKDAGMLDQADAFKCASGALATICYREDIESALRTNGMGGFQLLDLQDFPGQGTALVGVLNAFLESKGVVEPERWREFCCETVPLLGMQKYTWTTAETFQGRLRVSHYGVTDLSAAELVWTLSNGDGVSVHEGRSRVCNVPKGKVSELDLLTFPLSSITAPQKMTLTLRLDGTHYQNRYPIWVYPAEVKTTPPDSIRVVRAYDSVTRSVLEGGGTVLLLPHLDRLQHAIKGSFQCDFWCWPMFRRAALRAGVDVAPGTLGILCDPAHAALADFPTEFHSHWQWWPLV